jgi:N-acylglucosamine-6-phosphate 2-epimerase
MSVIERLRAGLIVSVQAEPGSVLDDPATIALLARCVVANGAAAVRVAGAETIRAVRAAVNVPIVGLIKGEASGFWPYITSSLADVAAICAAGADIVAFDATLRPRASGVTVAELCDAAQRSGRLAFADCATVDDGHAALSVGADIVATTLAGYTTETAGCRLPALDLVRALAKLHPFVVCEGGIAEPDQARAAFVAGASAVVVGTAITNMDALTRRFAAAGEATPAGLR